VDALKTAMAQGTTPLIYDNQNVKPRDSRAAAEAAEHFGYEIKIQEPTSEWWLDHSHMLLDKKRYTKELDQFANFLGGKHPDMARRYNRSPEKHGNEHGVPIHVIRKNLDKWQPNLTAQDILGRPQKKV